MEMSEDQKAKWNIAQFTENLCKKHYEFVTLNQEVRNMLSEKLSKPDKQNPADIISNLRSSNPIT